MPSIPSAREIQEQFGQTIEEFRTICRVHQFPTGHWEDLLELPMRLSRDAAFRADLIEIVRSLQARGDAAIGLSEVLDVLIIAVGTTDAFHHTRGLEEQLDLLGTFLASVGGWPGMSYEPVLAPGEVSFGTGDPARRPLDPSPAPAVVLTDSSAPASLPVPAATNPPAPATVSAPRPPAEASADNLDARSLLEIAEALSRLERGNLELRVHLDSIDQRISRMEPLLDTAAPPPVTALPPNNQSPLNPPANQPAAPAASRTPMDRPFDPLLDSRLDSPPEPSPAAPRTRQPVGPPLPTPPPPAVPRFSRFSDPDLSPPSPASPEPRLITRATPASELNTAIPPTGSAAPEPMFESRGTPIAEPRHLVPEPPTSPTPEPPAAAEPLVVAEQGVRAESPVPRLSNAPDNKAVASADQSRTDAPPIPEERPLPGPLEADTLGRLTPRQEFRASRLRSASSQPAQPLTPAAARPGTTEPRSALAPERRPPADLATPPASEPASAHPAASPWAKNPPETPGSESSRIPTVERPDRATSDRVTSDRITPDRTIGDRPTPERTTPERTIPERTTPERLPAERPFPVQPHPSLLANPRAPSVVAEPTLVTRGAPITREYSSQLRPLDDNATSIPFTQRTAFDTTDAHTGEEIGAANGPRLAYVIVGIVLLALAIAAFFYFRGSSPAPVPAPIINGNGSSSVPTNPAPPQPTASTPPPSSPAPAPSPRVLGARDAFRPSQSSEDLATSSRSPVTFVPGNVMDGRLLSAQIPNRPRIPGVTGSRAIVPVEVLISANGTVQSVRPLGGTHLLREAAINAVRNWRYRPFLRNGQPIPVRTVVRVDFNEHTPQPAQRSAPFPP